MAKFSQFGKSESKVTQQDIKNKFDQYKDMSSADLHSALFEQVGKQKQSGNFDYDSLKSMVQSLSGVLPEEDYQRVMSLLESLK